MARISYPPVPRRPVGPSIERLFWRAGFGPSAADRRTFATRGLGAAIEQLLHPPRQPLAGRALRYREGEQLRTIDPSRDDDDSWAQEVLWWVDRMVRTRAPLIERMTLKRTNGEFINPVRPEED